MAPPNVPGFSYVARASASALVTEFSPRDVDHPENLERGGLGVRATLSAMLASIASRSEPATRVPFLRYLIRLPLVTPLLRLL
jgi:hypothetical protein